MSRWLLGALILAGTLASAQALLRYPGDRPGGTASGGGGGSCVVLPLTFAWYGDSIAAGACSTTGPTAKLQALLGAGWLGSTDAGDGTGPAIGGYSAAQIRARYEATRDTACLGSRCGVYVVEGGVNSIINGATAAATLTDMVAIVDDARSLGRKVVWSNISPCRDASYCTEGEWTEAKTYNALWAAACAARPDIRCVDVGAGSAFEEAGTEGYLTTAPTSFTCDGIHFVQAGTDAWAALVQAAVEQLTENACR